MAGAVALMVLGVACVSTAGLNNPTPDATPGGDAAAANVQVDGQVDAKVDAQLPPGTIFSDTFDDPAPLPRAWDIASGAIAVVPSADAPSGPNVLQALSPAESKVRVRLTLANRSSFTCSFRTKLVRNEPVDAGEVTARIGGIHFKPPSGEAYLLLQLNADAWDVYVTQAPITGSDHPPFNIGSSAPIGTDWHTMTVTVTAAGAVTASLDTFVAKGVMTPVPFDGTELELGVLTQAGTIEVLYDDVACTAQ